MNKGFWFDIYKSISLTPKCAATDGTAIFRLDPIGMPKSWPKVTGKTMEEVIQLATQRYSGIYNDGGKIQLGNPDDRPYNPASLGSIFIPLIGKD